VRSPAVALALAALAAAPAPARAAEARPSHEGPRVALDPLRAPAIAPALREAVEERLCSEIARAARAEVVCPGDVAAALVAARHSAVFGECATDECLRRVDAMRSAERRVSGALERGEKGLVLSLQLAAGAAPGPRVVEKLPDDLDALLSRLGEAVDKLFPER
jgi:hypothetical protein